MSSVPQGSPAGADGVPVATAIAIGAVKPLPSFGFAIVGIRFLLAGSYELGAPSSLAHAAGIAGLVVVALAGYRVLAFNLEGLRHRAALPTFRRGGPMKRLDGDVRAARTTSCMSRACAR